MEKLRHYKNGHGSSCILRVTVHYAVRSMNPLAAEDKSVTQQYDSEVLIGEDSLFTP